MEYKIYGEKYSLPKQLAANARLLGLWIVGSLIILALSNGARYFETGTIDQEAIALNEFFGVFLFFIATFYFVTKVVCADTFGFYAIDNESFVRIIKIRQKTWFLTRSTFANLKAVITDNDGAAVIIFRDSKKTKPILFWYQSKNRIDELISICHRANPSVNHIRLDKEINRLSVLLMIQKKLV